MNAKPPMTTRAKPCSVCGQPRVPAFRAFCSAHCRDRDLLAWGDDRYILREDPGLSVDDISTDRLSGLDSDPAQG